MEIHYQQHTVEALPEGWTEGFDPQYQRTFYLNHVSKSLQWERPLYPAKEVPKISASVTPQQNTEPAFADVIDVQSAPPPPPIAIIKHVEQKPISPVRDSTVSKRSFSFSRSVSSTSSSQQPSPLKQTLLDMDREFNGPKINKSKSRACVISTKKKRNSIFG